MLFGIRYFFILLNCLIYDILCIIYFIFKCYYMNKSVLVKIMLWLLFVSILFFYFNIDNKKIENETINTVDYSDLWINPNDYKTLTWFLLELPSMSWSIVDWLDLMNDNFVLVNSYSWSLWRDLPIYNSDILWWLYNSKDDKNAVIAEIYTAFKDWIIQWWAWTNIASKIIFEQDIYHRETQTIKDILNFKLNVNSIIDEFSKIWDISLPKKELLAYLKEFKWDYSESNKLRKEIINENKNLIKHLQEITVKWKVYTQTNTPIPWVKITLLNNPKFNTTTNLKWEYELKFKYYNFSHLRFRATFDWYSDWFKTFQFNTYLWKEWNKIIETDYHLKKAEKTYSIDINDSDKVTDINWSKFFTVKSSQSEYRVPYSWLVDIDLNQYEWKNIEVFLYELNKWDNIDNLVSVDTFWPVYGYLGNMMKTFWMPYIQFFDKDTWEELFIKKSSPMILKNNIYHMQELYDNYDQVYEALTKDDMKWLVQKSKELRWYPLDQDFIQENNMLRFPARWSLDRKKWVWENVGFKVLSEDWLVEVPFYSINDID